MSTSALIGMLTHPDGEVEAIRLHFDGYPERAGEILKVHYNSDTKAEALVQMGDCSSLAPTIAESVFYERDRGEDNVKVTQVTNSLSFQAYADDNHVDHSFLWTGVEWVHTACS